MEEEKQMQQVGAAIEDETSSRPSAMSIPDSDVQQEEEKKRPSPFQGEQSARSKPPVMILPSSLKKLTSTMSTGSAGAQPTPSGVKSYTFAASRGNYPNHVIKALKDRGNWT